MSPRRHMGVTVLFVLALVTLWAAWLRFGDLNKQSFWLDEAVLVSQARGILKHGVPQMENGIVQWNSSVAAYIIAQGIRLHRDEHIGARLPAAIAGTLSVILLFIATRTFRVSNLAPLIASGIMALSIDQIAWSRQAEPYMYLQLFFIITIIFSMQYMEKKSPILLAGAILAAAASVGTHAGGYIAVLALGLSCITVLINHVARSPLLRKDATGRTRQVSFLKTIIPHWWGLAMLLGLLGILISFVRLPLGHSNIQVVFDLLQTPYKTNYVSLYTRVLMTSFGISGLLFAVFGAVAGLVLQPKMAIPLVVTCGVFFPVVSVRMWLFADRYIFPIQAIMVIFISSGLAWSSNFLGKLAGKRFGKVLSGLACCLLLTLFILDSNATVRPAGEYWLGHTAPQPDWRTGFILVRNRHTLAGAHQQQLNVVSPYPVLHDVYLGASTGIKYYLPISFCGTPNSVQWNAPHSQAFPIGSLAELKEIDGYLMMDEMALRMIGCALISSYLQSTGPDAIVGGRFPLFIWLLRNEKQPDKRED